MSPFLSLKSYSEEYADYPANSKFLSVEILKDDEGKAVIREDKIAWKVIINKERMPLDEQEIILQLSEHLSLDGIDEEGNVDLQKTSEPFEKEKLESKIYSGDDEISWEESKAISIYTRQIEGIEYFPQESQKTKDLKSNYLKQKTPKVLF